MAAMTVECGVLKSVNGLTTERHEPVTSHDACDARFQGVGGCQCILETAQRERQLVFTSEVLLSLTMTVFFTFSSLTFSSRIPHYIYAGLSDVKRMKDEFSRKKNRKSA